MDNSTAISLHVVPKVKHEPDMEQEYKIKTNIISYIYPNTIPMENPLKQEKLELEENSPFQMKLVLKNNGEYTDKSLMRFPISYDEEKIESEILPGCDQILSQHSKSVLKIGNSEAMHLDEVEEYEQYYVDPAICNMKKEEFKEDEEDLESDATSIPSTQDVTRKHNVKSCRRLQEQAVNSDIFKCDHCDYQTIRKRDLDRHLIRHKNPKEVVLFKCDQCDHQTTRLSTLRRHHLLHKNPEEVNRFKCDQCDFQTIHKYNIKLHILRHHKDPEELHRFKCNQCDYQSICKRQLQGHFLRHKNREEVDLFKCDLCDYETIRKCDLKKHLLRHKLPIPITCKQCGYQAFRKSDLSKHHLVHKVIKIQNK